MIILIISRCPRDLSCCLSKKDANVYTVGSRLIKEELSCTVLKTIYKTKLHFKFWNVYFRFNHIFIKQKPLNKNCWNTINSFCEYYLIIDWKKNVEPVEKTKNKHNLMQAERVI